MTDNTDSALDPSSTPNSLSREPIVKRITSMPIYIVGAIVASFLLILIYVVNKRSDVQQDQIANANRDEIVQVSPDSVQSAEKMADDIIGLVPDGIIKAEGVGGIPSQPDFPIDVIINGDSEDNENIVSADILALRDELNDTRKTIKILLDEKKANDLKKIQEMANISDIPPVVDEELEKMLAEIRKEKFDTFKMAVTGGSSVEGGGDYDPEKVLTQMTQEIDNIRSESTSRLDGTLSKLRELGSSAKFDGGGGLGFSGGENSDDVSFDLGAEREAGFKYELKSGGIIPAVLLSGVNSDLPGNVLASVSQNIYDTATGRNLIIPQGTRMFGTYDENIAAGQTRLLMRWDRLIFPDGSSLSLRGMVGADKMGFSGFNDKVNNHYIKVFGSAFLLSSLSAGMQLSLPDSDDSDKRSVKEEISLAVAQQFQETGSQMLKRNLQIQPTLEIRPGYKFNILANKDIKFTGPYLPIALK